MKNDVIILNVKTNPNEVDVSNGHFLSIQ